MDIGQPPPVTLHPSDFGGAHLWESIELGSPKVHFDVFLLHSFWVLITPKLGHFGINEAYIVPVTGHLIVSPNSVHQVYQNCIACNQLQQQWEKNDELMLEPNLKSGPKLVLKVTRNKNKKNNQGQDYDYTITRGKEVSLTDDPADPNDLENLGE